MSEMTGRERVMSALLHQEPDRVPIDLGGTTNTTITIEGYRRLCKHLGTPFEFKSLRKSSQTVVPSEPVLGRFHVDTRALVLGSPDGWDDTDNRDGVWVDEWMVERRKPPGCFYYELFKSPLAGDLTPDRIERHPWPDPHDPGRTRGLREAARCLHEQTGYAVVFSIPLGFVHHTQFLRGFGDWFEDLALRPELAGLLMDRVIDFMLAVVTDVIREAGEYMDVVLYGDDITAQNGPMFSPAVYRKLIKPRQKRIFDLVRSSSRARTLYHTCGAARPFLDDLIEIGADSINPVQVSAAGMETDKLKSDYGSQICFWGGIDTQEVLCHGSPQEVRREVRKRINDLAPGGGFVLSAVHNIQPDVPPGNVCAMFDAALEFGERNRK